VAVAALAVPTVALAVDDAASPSPGVAASALPGALGSVPATATQPRPAPELDGLVSPDGSAFELAAFEGEPVLVFFGYTHCPDVCPTTISELFGVIEAEPETQVLFVSVDPERDTPEFLAEWTAYLPEDFHAVTGSPGAVRRVADAWGVRYARVETTSTAGYTMSHTADVFLLDGEGTLRQTYPFGTAAEVIVDDLRTLDAGA
jgi:protein SCO1/2